MKIVGNYNQKDTIKLEKLLANNVVKCSCGHSIQFVNVRKGRVLCNWCNKYVYVDKGTEFKYKMKEVMNKR